MNLIRLSTSYLGQRALATFLNVMILALGIATIVVLLVISSQVQDNLTRSSRGIDLVVGAKGSPLQLILSSIYHIDSPTGNISVDEAKAVMSHRSVDTAIPLALGDTYRGFRVVGTTTDYAGHFGVELSQGQFWTATGDVTLGARVAEEAGLSLNDTFYSAHGLDADGEAHDEHPLTVTGILEPSGTVLDRLILTRIETVWEVHGIHADGEGDDDEHGDEHGHDAEDPGPAEAAGLPGRSGSSEPAPEYTAVLIKYVSPLAAATFPQYINSETGLQAAAPAFQTARLFELLGVGFDAVRGFGFVLVFVSILSIFVALVSALKDRRYDLAMMRTLGAPRRRLMSQVLVEGLKGLGPPHSKRSRG